MPNAIKLPKKIGYQGDGTMNAWLRQGHDLNSVLAAMGPYASRGDGRQENTGLTVAKVHRRIGASKYTPHQGKQEIARRKARLEAANG